MVALALMASAVGFVLYRSFYWAISRFGLIVPGTLPHTMGGVVVVVYNVAVIDPKWERTTMIGLVALSLMLYELAIQLSGWLTLAADEQLVKIAALRERRRM